MNHHCSNQDHNLSANGHLYFVDSIAPLVFIEVNYVNCFQWTC